MSSLDNQLFNLKFTAKQLNKQSEKQLKNSKKAEGQVIKALQQGNEEGARIYAANSIRSKNESLNMLRLSSRIDAVASRVESAVAFRNLSKNMQGVVGNMVKAMQTMDVEKISAVMDKFEEKFADLDVQTKLMEDSIQNTTRVDMPEDEVEMLLQRKADEANIERQQELGSKEASSKVSDLNTGDTVGEEDAKLVERLRALRPAT